MGEEAFFETTVYARGQDGYHTYRIPALLATQAGTLLAFCEGRKNGPADFGDIDLVVKRSADNGAAWSEQAIVHEEGGDAEIAIGNPCPVQDRDTGIVWLPFCRDNRRVFVTWSEDDGRSWAAPREITRDAVAPGWDWVATGPGVGIQLRGGPWKGRLAIPSDHRDDAAYRNGSHMIYSDDHGATWQRGEPLFPGPNECQAVELADGALLLNIRMQSHGQGSRA